LSLLTVRLRIAERARVEAASVTARPALALAFLWTVGGNAASPVVQTIAVLASLAMSNVVLLLGYLADLGPSNARLLRPPSATELRALAATPDFFSLLAAAMGRGLQMLLLQEMERVALLASNLSVDEAAAFALASALAGLIARLVLAPLDDAAISLFARASRPLGVSVIRVALQLASVLAVAVAVAAGPLAGPVLRLLYGRERGSEASGAPALLALYGGYIALCAANGMTEAFVRAYAAPATLHRMNGGFLLLAGGQFALALSAVPSFGAAAIVGSSALCVALRIAASAHMIGDDVVFGAIRARLTLPLLAHALLLHLAIRSAVGRLPELLLLSLSALATATLALHARPALRELRTLTSTEKEGKRD
jgi:hypothetical protein